jgi:class 3 adenylate cyclase
MGDKAERALKDGRAALERREWDGAFEFLNAADAAEPLAPSDLEGLAEAAFWSGHLDTGIAARERAHAAYLAVGQPRAAARVAMTLATDYLGKNSIAVASGWFATAQRLLADEPESVEHGRLALNEAIIALSFSGDLDHGLKRARAAYQLGKQFDDPDLQAQALHTQGRILVTQGRVPEGMALVDEAMTATVTGRIGPLAATHLFCFTLTLCQVLPDYRRAGEWMDAADHSDERLGISGRARHSGDCQAHRANILRVRGKWSEAEEAARSACDELGPGYENYHMGIAKHEIGLIQLRRGELDRAEESFGEAHKLGFPAQPGFALLRLAQGKADIALASLANVLVAAPLLRTLLLPAHVEIALAAGDLDSAKGSVEELEAMTETHAVPALRGAAAHARGALQLREEDAKEALTSLRAASESWREAEMPYEGAKTRVLLAEAQRALGNVDDALLELRSARSTFDQLGATPDTQRAIKLIEEYVRTSAASSATQAPVVRTLMFTDIVRSTNLLEAIGDEGWIDLLRWHDGLLRALFREHKGEEVKHAGDGFFVAFPDATSAVACSVAIQRSLAEHRRSHGFAPQVRIGLHGGDVVKEGKDYRGRGVHIASRVAGLAGESEIVATEETAHAAVGAVLSNSREAMLKGIGDRVRVVSIAWRDP